MAEAQGRLDGASLTAGTFQPISPYRAALGESPVWCVESRSVWWVNCEGRRLINTVPGGATRTWPTPETIGFVAPAFGHVLVGLETGLFIFNPAMESFEKVLDLEDREVRFNDAAVGAGYLWASTMDRGVEQPNGSVLRIGPDFTPYTCLAGFRRANGLAVDAARRRLYVSDSHPERASIAVATLDAGTTDILRIEPFAEGPPRPGRPDGAALDADGNYWIARVDAGLVDVMALDGRVVSSLVVPVPEPTKIAFGGPDMRSLFLTSKEKGALGGRLLAARLADTRRFAD